MPRGAPRGFEFRRARPTKLRYYGDFLNTPAVYAPDSANNPDRDTVEAQRGRNGYAFVLQRALYQELDRK